MRRFIAWTLSGLAATAATPEDRAIAFLAREVPAWRRENNCFSCHNNGDGARALYAARRLGRQVDEGVLRETTMWLTAPADWKNNRGDPRFSDKQLARLQFAAAAAEAGLASLREAAKLIVADQRSDGSWQIGAEGSAGSPATYGPALATAMAIRILERADAAGFRTQIQKARGWLKRLQIRSVPDAAAVLFAFPANDGGDAFLRRAQASDGGWGPAAGAPPEPFDTALALLALRENPEAGKLVARGRAWLTKTQLESGGWPETTRPAGGQSYAQHVSTAAWVTVALLETGR